VDEDAAVEPGLPIWYGAPIRSAAAVSGGASVVVEKATKAIDALHWCV
jgi:hypothetical protein